MRTNPRRHTATHNATAHNAPRRSRTQHTRAHAAVLRAATHHAATHREVMLRRRPLWGTPVFILLAKTDNSAGQSACLWTTRPTAAGRPAREVAR